MLSAAFALRCPDTFHAVRGIPGNAAHRTAQGKDGAVRFSGRLFHPGTAPFRAQTGGIWYTGSTMDAPTVFFDLDGTLIDSRKDIAASVNRTRADYGLPPLPLEAITGMVGNGVRQLLLRAMPEHEAQIEALVENNRAHYAAYPVVHTTMYPGVPEALAELKQMGCRLAVTSNKTASLIPRILEKLGILRYFDVTVGSGDVPVLKPDPGLLYLAAERMGVAVRPEDWVVGDHYTDLEVGRRAGVHVCHCAYGFGNPREERFDVRVNDLREFAAWVRALPDVCGR